MVPGTQHDVDFMVKDSKRFADSGGWGWGAFEYDAASDTFKPATLRTIRRRKTTRNAGSRATRWCRTATTFSRSTERGEYRIAKANEVDQSKPVLVLY